MKHLDFFGTLPLLLPLAIVFVVMNIKKTTVSTSSMLILTKKGGNYFKHSRHSECGDRPFGIGKKHVEEGEF